MKQSVRKAWENHQGKGAAWLMSFLVAIEALSRPGEERQFAIAASFVIICFIWGIVIHSTFDNAKRIDAAREGQKEKSNG